MARIFDVDKAISENLPKVRIRGELYKIRDLTMSEKIRRQVDLYQKQQKLMQEAFERGDADEKDYDVLQGLMAEAIQSSLEGVPDDVAESITETEFTLIQQAISRARDTPIDIEETYEEDSPSGEKKGGSVEKN